MVTATGEDSSSPDGSGTDATSSNGDESEGDSDPLGDSETGSRDGSDDGPGLDPTDGAEPEPPRQDVRGVCGDGIVDPDEACDDGNDVDGDGCNAGCVPSGSAIWCDIYDGGRGNLDAGQAIVVDDLERITVAGFVTTADGFGVQAWGRGYTRDGGIDWTRYWFRGEEASVAHDLALGGSEFVVVGEQSTEPRGWVVAGSASGPDDWSAPHEDRVAMGVGVGTDGTIAVVGHTGGSGDQQGWIAVYEPDGELVWERLFGAASDAIHRFLAVAPLPDGGWAVVGSGRVGAGDTNGIIRTYGVDGSFGWMRGFAGSGDAMDAGYDVVVEPSTGDVIAVGMVTELENEPQAWINRLDPVGNSLWLETFSGSARAVALDPSGDIVLGGEQPDPYGAWVRRLDGDGVERWVVDAGALEGGSGVTGIALGGGDRIYVTGWALANGEQTDVWTCGLEP